MYLTAAPVAVSEDVLLGDWIIEALSVHVSEQQAFSVPHQCTPYILLHLYTVVPVGAMGHKQTLDCRIDLTNRGHGQPLASEIDILLQSVMQDKQGRPSATAGTPCAPAATAATGECGISFKVSLWQQESFDNVCISRIRLAPEDLDSLDGGDSWDDGTSSSGCSTPVEAYEADEHIRIVNEVEHEAAPIGWEMEDNDLPPVGEQGHAKEAYRHEDLEYPTINAEILPTADSDNESNGDTSQFSLLDMVLLVSVLAQFDMPKLLPGVSACHAFAEALIQSLDALGHTYIRNDTLPIVHGSINRVDIYHILQGLLFRMDIFHIAMLKRIQETRNWLEEDSVNVEVEVGSISAD